MNVALFFILTLVAVGSALPTSTSILSNAKGVIRPQIMGGEEAGEKEFPYFVSIFMESCIPWITPICLFLPGCGGVIYDETRIITSAKCASYVPGTTTAVVAGNGLLNATYDQRQDIASVILHENYSVDSPFDNDIAILTLAGPLVYDDRVQPIRLAEISSAPSGDVVICGYGEEDGELFQFKKATLSAISNEECEHDLESFGIPITENMVCAKKPSEGITSFDFGGPMVAKDEAGIEYLAGISSWGVDSAGEYPSVFANIAHLRPWLESKLNP